ncbi:hypothetical protein [Paenibacillus foliorum]|uniref:hypothetical protein n=1 Tax=Paenibacillus foliorum TaxID=2654974 RepID=UPI0035E43A8B
MSRSIHCCASGDRPSAATLSGSASFQPSSPAFHFVKSGMQRPCTSASFTCGAKCKSSCSSRLQSSFKCWTALGLQK